jgi:hypothetical protein
MLSARPRLEPGFGVVPRYDLSSGQEIRPSFVGDATERRVDFILFDRLRDRVEDKGVRGLSGTCGGSGHAGFQVGFNANRGRRQS